MVRNIQKLEPESANLSQDFALIRNAIGQHVVEGGNPIGADHQELVTQIVDVPDLTSPTRPLGKSSFQNCGH